MKNSQRQSPSGFTLVELLVVITIIGILTALISVAAVGALDTAKQTAIKSELDQLDMAMKDFKNKYGAYPPCDLSNPTTNTTLQSFIIQAFPRYPITTQLVSDWTALSIDQINVHPDRALVFWLSGFSPDVTNPFTGLGQRTPFFTFDQTRLMNMTNNTTATPAAPNSPNYIIGQVAYVPPRGNGTPYVYIDVNNYGTLPISTNVSAGNVFSYIAPNASNLNTEYTSSPATISRFAIFNSSLSLAGYATPYVQDMQNMGSFVSTNTTGYQFCNPSTFQIISAGQDGFFGSPNPSTAANVRLYPTAYGWDSAGADIDNNSNFSGSARLGDAIP